MVLIDFFSPPQGKLYGNKDSISERHRHRYEVISNN